MRRGWFLLLALTIGGCAQAPTTPAAVVVAALDAARGGDLDGFLAFYTPSAARDLKRAVAAAEGAGWVPRAPLRLLTPGAVEEVSQDGDLAVVTIRSRGTTTAVCLTRTDAGWRLLLDEAVLLEDDWTCRPYISEIAQTFGEDHAAEE